MTTVKNGSSITYNRSGMTIDSLTAQGTSSGGSTATITRNAGKTIVLLGVTSGVAYACNLPSGAEVGDVVEIYSYPDNDGRVYITAAGESFIDGTTDVGYTGSFKATKVSSTQWAHTF